MAIIQRRVFFGKAGASEQLIDHIREAEKRMQQYGVSFKSRMLSDYQSGRTDRVVMEWEANDLSEIDAAMSGAMANPEAQVYFGAWTEKLNGLIHYAEVETWSIR